VRRDLSLLAKKCARPTQRSLLVEFFLLDDGRVVVFLVPLWDLKSLEIEQIPLAPGFAARLVGDVLATTDPSLRIQTRAAQASGELGESARVHLERLIGQMGVLVEPWASRLDDWQPTELIFASHSFLNLLPIHAASFHGKPLIAQFPVAYLPSATLAEALGRRKRRDIDTALLIGNPTQDLRGAQMEVQRAANQFGGADIKVECFIGSHATSDCVRTHAPGSSVVHFACHSGIDHYDFLRSGFHLSDRRVTVLEIMTTLDLKHASLVYLSSCDSARPVVGRTEELMALARSFLYAGSPTVIASLVPLDDNAGRIFAESFYDAWLSDRDSMIRAFQSAMLRTSAMEQKRPQQKPTREHTWMILKQEQ
jgi:CHAT domain-containing protein